MYFSLLYPAFGPLLKAKEEEKDPLGETYS